VQTASQPESVLLGALYFTQLVMVLTPQSCYNLERNQGFNRDYYYEFSTLNRET